MADPQGLLRVSELLKQWNTEIRALCRKHAKRLLANGPYLEIITDLCQRLEIGYAFDVNGKPIECENDAYDGIVCRDATIKLLEERIDELKQDISNVQRERDEARYALESIRSEIDGMADVSDGPDGIADQPNVFMRIDMTIDAAIGEAPK